MLSQAVIERFWSLVDKNGPMPPASTKIKTKCWMWKGGVRTEPNGFPRFRLGKVEYQPRRVSYEIHTGKPVGKKNVISLKCGNMYCVRHLLFVDDQLALIRRSGINHHMSKFTKADILQIRKLAGQISQQDLADSAGVSVNTINKIQSGRTYKTVP